MATGSALNIALPNQTVYINNLNDKLSKELLRRFLSPHSPPTPAHWEERQAVSSGAGASVLMMMIV